MEVCLLFPVVMLLDNKHKCLGNHVRSCDGGLFAIPSGHVFLLTNTSVLGIM